MAVLFSLFYLLIGVNVGLSVYDEGVLLYGATRILDGDVPYRDFWSIYAPGQFYLLAGLFRLLAPSIVAARIFSSIVNLALVVAVYLVLRQLLSRALSLVGLLLALVWMGSLWLFAYAVFTALLFILLSCCLLVRYLFRRRLRDLALSGLAVGVAALFRHDLGFYAVVSEVALLVGFSYANPILPEGKTRGVRVAVLPYCLGLAVVAVPAIAYFLSKVPAETLLHDLVLFPFKVFPKVRGLPYPRPSFRSILFYLPFLVHGAAIVLLVGQVRARAVRRDSPRVWTLILFVSLGILFFNQVRIRSDVQHLFPLLLSSVVPLCLLVDHSISHLRGQSPWTRNAVHHVVTAVVVLMAALSLGQPLYERWRILRIYWEPMESYTFEIERAKGIVAKDAMAYQDLVRFIRERVPEGERMYVGPLQHDLVSMCDVLLYFLADRHSATRFHEVHPGLTTTEKVQLQIVRDIEASRVGCVVLVDHFEREPNESGISSGVKVLDDFIRANFVPVRKFQEYIVWRRTHP